MKLALTANGPGEFSGWVRPLLHALFRLDPSADVTIFFVPDDYATGREPEVARAMFPRARVVSSAAYLGFAVGRTIAGLPANVDVVLYLGGDLAHAARVHARLGGALCTYKFARPRLAARIARAYAVDQAGEAALARAGVPPERIVRAGNLAIDGALEEAHDPPAVPVAPHGILVMPGTRRAEIAYLVPFFLQMLVRLRAEAPELSGAFAISPFTLPDDLARALADGGDPRFWGARGRLVGSGDDIAIEAGGAPGARIPVVREAMRHAPAAKAVVTIPGTKCIELAALGVPTVVCVPANAPEAVVINGPLTYLDRVPFVGTAIKRSVVLAYESRFRYTAQPNIDAQTMLMPELRGTLTPGAVARAVAAYARDDAARASDGRRLRDLYADQAGAAERVARDVLELAGARVSA